MWWFGGGGLWVLSLLEPLPLSFYSRASFYMEQICWWCKGSGAVKSGKVWVCYWVGYTVVFAKTHTQDSGFVFACVHKHQVLLYLVCVCVCVCVSAVFLRNQSQ